MIGNKPVVLFVDDEERILRSLKMLFMMKYDVKTTTDGSRALAYLRANHVDVLVSDQRMPEMTGVEVLRQAKKISPNTMRLLLTGYSDLAAIVGSVNDGEIFRYINKPWRADEIQSIVGQAVDISMRLQASVIVEEEKKEIGLAQSPMTISVANAAAQENLSLLVLDDDESTYSVVKNVMGEKHQVHWHRDLEEAFSLIAQENVGVIVSEISLSGVDITGSLKTLKQMNPNILTLVLTSFQDTKVLIELINHGQVYRFLPKPVHHGLLEKSLEAALQYQRSLSQRPELSQRHAVEKLQDGETPAFSKKVMSYLGKIRERARRLGINTA